MINKIFVVAGILIVVGLVLFFVSDMTGNVITGSTADEGVVENEYFKIGKNETNKEDLNESQNSTEPKVPYK